MTTATETPAKLDLACGQNKQDGFYGVDIAGDADLIHDLTEMPWPFPDASVEEIFVSHYVEHTYPLGGPRDGLIAFMDECYRILRPDGKLRIIHPYALSTRAFQDPTHTRFIPEVTWWYFNAEWRETQRLDHYPIVANYRIDGISNGFTQEWTLRSEPARVWASQHYWNVITDLQIDLTAIKD